MSQGSALRSVFREPVAERMSVESLSVSYGRQRAFAGVDLAFPEGEVTALVGPSGCGKSTFLQALNRLTDMIPNCRVEGRIQLDGESIHGPEVDVLALRRQVGMIFQRPNPFPLSIRQNLTLPLREHGMSDADRLESTVRKALEDVGLWTEVRDRLDRPAVDLSGGQKQRLCIARALVLEPEVVLFDEPCSSLDPLASAMVEDLIASLRGRFTVVVVTHNLAQARRISDRTVLFWVLDGVGRLVETAPTTQFFEEPTAQLTRDYVSGVRG